MGSLKDLVVILMKSIRSIDKVIARCEGWLIILFLWLMVILTFIRVCLRGLYTHGHLQWANTALGHLDWSEPLVRFLVLWLTFLGASLVTGENKHIKIDLFSTVIPPKWLPVCDLLLSVVCVGISAIMLKVCIGYVSMEMEFGGRLFLSLPSWIAQLILPVGFGLICFRFFLRAIDQGLKIVKAIQT
jgi:TRAP-type C4-dicarboxylate transport system permease small subunit